MAANIHLSTTSMAQNCKLLEIICSNFSANRFDGVVIWADGQELVARIHAVQKKIQVRKTNVVSQETCGSCLTGTTFKSWNAHEINKSSRHFRGAVWVCQSQVGQC
ncbi:hypothetical protein [Synechococcus sp. MU1625]|uniref:hypothetical protein n=1 Tax=Synechococcus sp. MU1625 TaxID=2508347 RepID=UPI001CF902C4|nr:hypothetical protein [Synechococcus sp. MU1625]MCB4400380.1 hypothetical protein [Synechococcus sp. MU1625]